MTPPVPTVRRRRLDMVLVWRVVAVATVGLVVAVGALLWSLAHHLRETADQDLTAVATLLESPAGVEDEALATFNEDRVSRILPQRALVALVTSEGAVRAIGSGAVPVASLPLGHTPGETFAFTVGDRHYRGLIVGDPQFEILSNDGTMATAVRVLVAIDVSADRATVRTVSIVAGLVMLVVLTAIGTLSGIVVRRSLRPVSTITAIAARIAATGNPEAVPRDTEFVETESLAAAVDDALTRRFAAERAIRTFLADASHELRTPIAKIQGWTDLVINEDLDTRQASLAMDAISNAAEELAVVVAELSLLAKLESPAPHTIHDIDVGVLALDVANDALEVASQATVSVDCPQNVILRGERDAVRTALRNLVGNAMQHGEGHITISITPLPNGASIAVGDEGPGVPLDLRERVLDRFFTTAPGSSHHSGLGLSIVVAVARRHGGEVTVGESNAGGALITATFMNIVSGS